MQPKETLILKACELSHNAPTAWREFLDAMDVYARNVSDQCVQSPLDALQRNQGRAQQAAEFVTLFRGAASSADRIKQSAALKARSL